MYEKHMLARDDIQSVVENGVGTGFIVKLKIPYYRGVCLSLVEDIQVRFNDRLFTRDQLTFSVSGETFTFKEMETQTTFRWEFGEKATVFVPLPGGSFGYASNRGHGLHPHQLHGRHASFHGCSGKRQSDGRLNERLELYPWASN